jgi:hypothetical protein
MLLFSHQSITSYYYLNKYFILQLLTKQFQNKLFCKPRRGRPFIFYFFYLSKRKKKRRRRLSPNCNPGCAIIAHEAACKGNIIPEKELPTK